MTSDTETARSGSWRAWHPEDEPIRLGVSACLLGDEVRYDGGHARSRFVVDGLGRWVEWTPVCPEVASGMSTPRPAIRLVEDDAGVHLVDPASGADFTSRMNGFAREKVASLDELDGYVLKKSSPSCGMERVRVYRESGIPRKNGRGLFAEALMDAWPNLPVEEEGRLNDPVLRENFVERVFCRHRWRSMLRRGVDRGRLVEFHTAHKLLLRAHDEAGYRRLGRLIADLGIGDDRAIQEQYEAELQSTLRHKATPKKHANVLQHAMGHLKRLLDPESKRAILTAIDDMREGMLPLIVPLTLVRYEVLRHEVQYLAGQLYFEPHPKELMLRNHC